MRPCVAGSVHVRDRKLRGGDPRAAIAAGIAHVPEDRLGTGVAPSLNIAENAVLKSYRGPRDLHRPVPELEHDPRGRARPDPSLRRFRTWAAPSGPRPVRRQPAEAHPRPRVLQQPEGADRRFADARARRRRDRDRARVPARGCRRRSRGAADQRGPRRDPRALADRVVVMYEGELTGEFDPTTATVEEIGLAMAGGERERDHRRAPAEAAALAQRTPSRSCRSPSRSSSWRSCSLATGHDPLAHVPAALRRRLRTAAQRGRTRSRWRRRCSSPGSQPRSPSGCSSSTSAREGQLYIGAICATGAAIWLGPHHGLWMTILAMCVCGAAGGGALGADRRRAEGLRPHERDHHHADAQLRRRAPAHVPDLRQRLAVARRVDDPDPVVPAVGRPEAEPVLADRDRVRRRRSRSASCSRSR